MIFNYPKYEKTTHTSGVRHYHIDGKDVPSVTTILASAKDMTYLDNWRSFVGEKQADFITKESTTIGTHMHDYLENYVTGKEQKSGDNPYLLTGHSLAKVIIDEGLKYVSKVCGAEVVLHFDDLYAGTSDLIGYHGNLLSVIDYKNTRKPKKDEYVEGYKLQLVAYALAHNNMFGTDIRDGHIFMVSRDDDYFGKFQTWHLTGNEFETYCHKWADILENYWKNQ